ncbi:MAG: (Fe-S)-binding protein [Phycisphaerae bacterium]|nr:(Fe-S)-binding protein [Phycisphaerae bacterium]
MTMLLLAGWGIFAWSAWRRWKLMMVGAAENRADQPGERLKRTLRYAIAQVRMRRYPLAGIAHLIIFFGFAVLLLRSLILWGRGYDPSFDFWIFGTDQPLGKIYALLKDIFALLVILGTLVFVYYRVIARLPRMTLSFEGLLILIIILVMMVSDIFYDGASMVRAARAPGEVSSHVVTASTVPAEPGEIAFVPYEPAGSVAAMMVQGFSDRALVVLAHAGFWTHAALVLIFLNLLPYSKHFHVITAIPNVYTQSLKPARLPPIIDIEGKLEREETLGIRRINQFTWKAILDFYTCTECGRCSDHCPATNTGKKLSPKHFTLDLRDFLYAQKEPLVAAKASGNGSAAGNGEAGDNGQPDEHHKDLVDGVIDPEVLWACTTCRACEQECPVFISYVDKIVDMRRYLVQERGEFPNQLQSAFKGLETNANPWSFPAEDRAAWAEGLDIPTLAEKPDVPVLLWVGCAPAFDERAKKVTRATARLLQKAGVDFAILGTEEQCTGDPARRAGNEYLFQMFAQANIEVLNGYGVDKKTVVTVCPHCFNTLKNEYADFGGNYNVVHHTTFLAGLIRQGKLKPTRRVDRAVAFHDSCYLGRYNDVYDDPRTVLSSIPGVRLVEPVQTRDRGMCCGAGGAQMFKEEEEGKERVNVARTQQLLDTKPDAIGSACPFCMRMLIDGLAEKEKEDLPQLDVAEMLLEAVEIEEPVASEV